jgi:hypothetical protein
MTRTACAQAAAFGPASAADPGQTRAFAGVVASGGRVDQVPLLFISCAHQAKTEARPTLGIPWRTDGAVPPAKGQLGKRRIEAGTVRRAV